jgi:hypothetical protein
LAIRVEDTVNIKLVEGIIHGFIQHLPSRLFVITFSFKHRNCGFVSPLHLFMEIDSLRLPEIILNFNPFELKVLPLILERILNIPDNTVLINGQMGLSPFLAQTPLFC